MWTEARFPVFCGVFWFVVFCLFGWRFLFLSLFRLVCWFAGWGFFAIIVSNG